jgi:hypothetical protein
MRHFAEPFHNAMSKGREPLGGPAHNESNKAWGCVRREARTSADGQTILHYRGDSDSHLVRGLISISISLFSDRAPKQILAVDALGAFRALGLEQRLTPQRCARHDRAHPRGRRCSLSSASIRVSDPQKRRDFRVPATVGSQASSRIAQNPTRAAAYLSRAIEPKEGPEPVAEALSVELTGATRVPG